MDSMMAEDGLLMGNLKAKRVANHINETCKHKEHEMSPTLPKVIWTAI